MQDVMIDLETLGTVPGCSILSIGAVAFNTCTGEIDDGLYTIVSRESCKKLGLHEDDGTIKWWEGQGEKARDVLIASASQMAAPLPMALEELNAYLRQYSCVRVWGNGADFDNPILACAYRVAGVKPGWAAYNGRCYRTVKNMAKHVKLVRSGTHHNALDDAISQAKHLMDIVSGTTFTLA